MKRIFILHSAEGVHLIASNIKVIYECLKENEHLLDVHALRSYSWYCENLTYNKNSAIARKDEGSFVISVRPIMSKWIASIAPQCRIDVTY